MVSIAVMAGGALVNALAFREQIISLGNWEELKGRGTISLWSNYQRLVLSTLEIGNKGLTLSTSGFSSKDTLSEHSAISELQWKNIQKSLAEIYPS